MVQELAAERELKDDCEGGEADQKFGESIEPKRRE
jgi:hypothetical protein